MSAKYGDWTRGEDEALLNKLGGIEVARNILKGMVGVELITKVVSFITHTFTILVDETKKVEDAVKAGKFNWVNDNITSKNFPKLSDGKKLEKETVLFHFNKGMSSEAVIAEMDKAGYKPANIWDLIGLAEKQPDLQREFPIVALGSVCKLDGDRNVAYLGRHDSKRDLNLYCFDSDWGSFYQFAGVRK